MSPILLLALACAPADSTETTMDGSAIQVHLGDNPGEPAPDFEPHAFFLTGWTGLDAGALVDPHPDATLTFTFWTEEGFRTGDAAESCEWIGHASLVAPAQIVDAPDVLAAAEVSVDLVQTDCLRFPSEVWGDDTPTAALTDTRIALGHGPMSPSMHMAMTKHYDRQGVAWGHVADAAFSTWFAVDSGAGFEGQEIGAALAYDANDVAPLEPLAWTGELPDGVVFTETVVPLGPAWIE